MKNQKNFKSFGGDGDGYAIGGGSGDITADGISKFSPGGGSSCARNGGGSSCVQREGWDG